MSNNKSNDDAGAMPERKPPVLTPAPTLNMEALRLSPSYAKAMATTKVQSTVPVDKPANQLFFRVHPTNTMDVAALENKADDQWYLVMPEVAMHMDSGSVKPKTLYMWMDRSGTYGIWPCGLPLDDGTDYTAWQSAHTVCAAAMTRWLRIAWNKSAGGYDIIYLSDAVQVPEPIWPEIDFLALLEKAFKGRVIADLNHPVLRRLRGEM